MSKIGWGYGSEYQLLRYLGHHRNYLDREIKNVTGSDSPIQWLDYPVNIKSKSLDGELKNIECFKDEPFYESLRSKWKTFWPQTGNSHNWDGIFIQDGIWYFVEAKAHTGEAHQRCSAKEYGGKPRILQAFIPTCEGNKTLAKQWLESDCYQLANRLAFIHFCKTNGINAKLCLISFLNGNKRSRKEVHNTETWDKVWEEEYSTLSLTKTQRDDILRVYIECNNG